MNTLRRRLTLTHTLVAFLAVVLSALLAQGFIARAYGQLAREQARQSSQRLGDVLTGAYMQRGEWDSIVAELEQRADTAPQLINRRIVLADENWRVRFDSADVLEGRAMPLRMRPQSIPLHPRNNRGYVIGHLAVPVGGQDQSEAERVFLRSATVIVISGSILASGVALLTALLLARHLTRPLQSLTQAARRLASGERHQTLDIPADAELAEMAQAFNTMAEQLEQQETLRRQMVADIAHELRTPLSVLRLQVEALEDNIEQPTPEVYASLHEEVDVLTRLVEDLRLLSIADAGQLRLAPEALDAREVAARAVAAAAPHARARGIILTTEASDQTPNSISVYADPQRLAQVLGNLLENALRYTPPGGRVTVRVQPEAAQVVFAVADTGSGIAPENLPHIFERFYRAERARTREGGGTGLGLAIVQRLVELHGGSVAVESTPGQGSTFYVRLPATAATVTLSPQTAPGKSGAGA